MSSGVLNYWKDPSLHGKLTGARAMLHSEFIKTVPSEVGADSCITLSANTLWACLESVVTTVQNANDFNECQ